MLRSLGGTLVAALLLTRTFALLNSTISWPVYIKYTTVTGYFLQDDPDSDPSTFDYVRKARYNLKELPLTLCRQRMTSA
jgi:hypothetical protein